MTPCNKCLGKTSNQYGRLTCEKCGHEISPEEWQTMLDIAHMERDEARAAFDAAMEYAESGFFALYDGDNEPIRATMHFTKPRPVAPWKGEE